MKAKNFVDFHPKFFDAMKNYSREKFSADVMAGIIVGVVAIPLAIAFGIASGVGPTEGLVTAIIAGALISIFGGSKVRSSLLCMAWCSSLAWVALLLPQLWPV